jgi:hypothetical protein
MLATRTSGLPSGGSFGIYTDDTVTVGRMVRFRVDFTDANGLFSRDTLSMPLGAPTVLAFDDASSGTGKWTITGSAPTWASCRTILRIRAATSTTVPARRTRWARYPR